MTTADFGFDSDDTIVITGAGSGIGRAAAIFASELGLKVSAWDLRPDGLAETVATLRDNGGVVHEWVADVVDKQRVEEGLAAARTELGPVKYLYNNAGPAANSGLDFETAIGICLGSVHTVTEAWDAAGPGADAAMVVTVSIAGNVIGTESDWYSAAKAGLMGYVRHLAAHRAAGFRSNAVAPGMTDTPRLAGFAASEVGQRVLTRIPLHRMATPEDIAHAALFLLSPYASYINGVFLPVDGGWTVTQ